MNRREFIVGAATAIAMPAPDVSVIQIAEPFGSDYGGTIITRLDCVEGKNWSLWDAENAR